MMPFDQEEIRPSYTDKGREYYNRTNSAKYVQMTDTGFRRKIQKIEAENGITIPMITRGGQQKLVDKRILDQFRKGIYVVRVRLFCVILNICHIFAVPHGPNLSDLGI